MPICLKTEKIVLQNEATIKMENFFLIQKNHIKFICKKVKKNKNNRKILFPLRHIFVAEEIKQERNK